MGSKMQRCRAVEVSEATTTTTAPGPPPAVLPDTPTSFPIAADDLITLAQKVFHETNTGITDDSVLSEDFRFEFPIVSLDRAGYLKAVRNFDLAIAFPNMNSHPYHWRVDPYEPNRVWFTLRTTGTHTGTLKFGSKAFPATGKDVFSPPECCSYVFNEQGKVKTFTGGVVMDRRVGNTGGLGALFGILTAIGVPVPKPGSIQFQIAVAVNNILTWFKGIFGKKE